MLVFVGSKFGAGVLPGMSSASSRKLRPLSGRLSIWREVMTPSITEETVFTPELMFQARDEANALFNKYFR